MTRQVEYARGYYGETESDLWLGSINFTPPLEYSLFSMLYDIPLLRHCIDLPWEEDPQRWRQRQLPMAEWCQQLIEQGYLHPLFHHWLLLHDQRSMRGVSMNSLGWFDFKSAWFAPPQP
ncbi:SgrR family transcriptional regulator [Izhakiella capsodis]|uniref:SgrR family transcriptional regulator n=1 Tax=Izhakiella capsodis TaxID=1367852 RepID=A0A1I4WX49_9GAMM|nr:SgrR family transcriptional regulator [Izhakiella capsodis]